MVTPGPPPYVISGITGSDGRCVASFNTRDNLPTRVGQVSPEMLAAGADLAACTVRFNGHLISPAIPTGDAVGQDPPVWMGVGDTLTVEWTGAPAGAVGNATIIYDHGDSW